MGITRPRQEDDKGATIVEAAIVYGLLFLALFAVLEFGLAFKDWLSVSHAAREGARAGATYGDDPRADIQILNDVAATLAPASIANGIQVSIYKADGTAPSSPWYTYTPQTPDCTDNSPGLILVGCCEWTPCPEPFRDSYMTPYWDPSTRKVDAPFTDRIAVQVFFTHSWITGFFAPDVDFTTVTDFQIEPQVFSS